MADDDPFQKTDTLDEVLLDVAALIERGVEVEQRGDVDYMLSNFTNSLKRMPVELRTR